jgi:hypothetical protein
LWSGYNCAVCTSLSPDALQVEALVALLAVQLAASLGYNCLLLGGDAFLVVLTINNHSSSFFFFSFFFFSWTYANCIYNISLVLSSFQSWNNLKVSRCANFRAHALAKWAASHHVFGSIPTESPILSFLVTLLPYSIKKK